MLATPRTPASFRPSRPRRGTLRRLAQTLLIATTLLASSSALAQFTNNSIGFQAGYMGLERAIGAKSGPVVGVESTLYIESGFDLTFRVLAGIHEDVVTTRNAVGVFPAVGVRYLFSEDVFRPYVGLALAYLHFFGADSVPSALFSASPYAGFEYYFQSNTAFGLQAEYHRILALNEPGGNAFAGVARISWGF